MGTRFHADLSFPAGEAAGAFLLFDPGASSVCITYASFSTDTNQRFVIGPADAQGQRILAGFIAGGAGAQRERVWDSRASLGGDGKPIYVITTQAGAWDASIDGEYQP